MFHNLSQGMSGTQVKAIQQALNIWMPDKKPIKDDGKFGPMTKAAVIAFQTRKQLKADGIVGPYTLTAIYPAVPYAGHGELLLGSGGGAGVRTAQAAPVATGAGTLTLEHIPGIPVSVPVPQGGAAALAKATGGSGLPSAPVAQPGAQPKPAPNSGGVQFQKTAYQFNTTTTWPINLSKPGLTGLSTTVKGIFLLGGKALTLSTGATGTVAVDNGAKDSAAAILSVGWAPRFLEIGDLASLSLIAQLSVGVFKVTGSSKGPSAFHQEAFNLKLSLKNSVLFTQFGITLTQDQNSHNLGLHAPTPGFGLAAGFTF